ncbi:unnamed protein product [Dicrocoelium dendriticum]|nr:unnamed protein product [Dicrocoelium dendriticum]
MDLPSETSLDKALSWESQLESGETRTSEYGHGTDCNSWTGTLLPGATKPSGNHSTLQLHDYATWSAHQMTEQPLALNNSSDVCMNIFAVPTSAVPSSWSGKLSSHYWQQNQPLLENLVVSCQNRGVFGIPNSPSPVEGLRTEANENQFLPVNYTTADDLTTRNDYGQDSSSVHQGPWPWMIAFNSESELSDTHAGASYLETTATSSPEKVGLLDHELCGCGLMKTQVPLVTRALFTSLPQYTEPSMVTESNTAQSFSLSGSAFHTVTQQSHNPYPTKSLVQTVSATPSLSVRNYSQTTKSADWRTEPSEYNKSDKRGRKRKYQNENAPPNIISNRSALCDRLSDRAVTGEAAVSHMGHADEPEGTQQFAFWGSDDSGNGAHSPTRHRLLNKFALEIMDRWFYSHIDNPYPSMEEKKKLAEVGGITVAQVASWFANRRTRTSNTRPKKSRCVFFQKVKELSMNLEHATHGLICAEDLERQFTQMVNQHLV